MDTPTEPLSWTIGAVEVTRVEERIFPVPWSALIPEGESLVDECRPWLDPFISPGGSRFLLSVHSFVVRTPDTLIVVDTCIGDDGDHSLAGDPGFGDRLIAALPGGFDAVDVVVCTHAHFDHVGWNTMEVAGERLPRFSSARYLLSSVELDAERDEEDSLAFDTSIAPLARAGCLDAVAPDHQIDPWVRIVSSPGHTPGHVSVRIESDGAVGLITGDMVHSPLQFAYPAAASTPDHDPRIAEATRRRFAKELCDTDVLVLGTHFAPPTSGYLRSDDSGIRLV